MTRNYCVTPRFVRNENDIIIYDTIKLYFCLKVFVIELTVHVMWPLFNWYYPLAHGHRLGENIMTHVYTSLIPLCVLMSCIAYGKAGMTQGDVVLPILLFLIHRVMVAFKYATLSPTEYKRMLEAKNETEVEIYRSQTQLVVGWLQYNPVVIGFEVKSAAARIGIDINSFHFLLPSPDSIPTSTRKERDVGLDSDSDLDSESPLTTAEGSSLTDDQYALLVLKQWEGLLGRPLITVCPNADRAGEHLQPPSAALASAVVLDCDADCGGSQDHKDNDKDKDSDNDNDNNIGSGNKAAPTRTLSDNDVATKNRLERMRRIKVSVSELVECIISKAHKKYPFTQSLSWVVTIASACVSLTPLIVNTDLYSPHLLSQSNYPWPIVYVAVSVPVIQILCVTNFLILVLTSSLDVRRRLYAASVLSELVRPTLMDSSPEIIIGFGFGKLWRKVKAMFVRRDKHVVSTTAERRGQSFKQSAVSKDKVTTTSPSIAAGDEGEGGARGEGDMDTANDTSIAFPNNSSSNSISKRTASPLADFGIKGDLESNIGKEDVVLQNIHNNKQYTNSISNEQMNEEDDDDWGELSRHMTPKLNLEIPQNVYAWLYARLILMTFGQRMLFRITAYVEATFTLVCIVMAGLVVAVLHSTEPRKMVVAPIFIQCMILVVLLVLYLMYLIWIASDVNEEFIAHRQFLTINVLKIEAELSEILVGNQDQIDVEMEAELLAKQKLFNQTSGPLSTATTTASDESSRRQLLPTQSMYRTMFNSSFQELPRRDPSDRDVEQGQQDQVEQSQLEQPGQQQAKLPREGPAHSRKSANSAVESQKRHRINWRASLGNAGDQLPQQTQHQRHRLAQQQYQRQSSFSSTQSSRFGFGMRSASALNGISQLRREGEEDDDIVHGSIDRYQMFEYEESIKALRRSMEAIDISNQQWDLKICGFSANKALLFTVLSGCFVFVSTLYSALKANKRQF